MKMWGGRFETVTDSKTDSYTNSFYVDYRLYKYDILGSIAHCVMLSEQGIISIADQEIICRALKIILTDIEKGDLHPTGAEDIHSFIEQELVKRIGDIGKKLHTARSRNDQVALDLRMYLKHSAQTVGEKLKILIRELITMSTAHIKTIMPGYTHMQKAQPVTLGHHLMAYVEMLLRDAERMKDCQGRIDFMPLGAGAIAGSSYNIDRKFVAERLGFKNLCANSIDAVSDRDFVIEFISGCSMIMMHLSRLSEEIVLWSTAEFGFVQLDDRFATGSSMMPQKKNPDIAELVRGRTGKVYGDLMAVLTMMKGLPLSYNRDMQEDKESLFEAEHITNTSLDILAAMLPTLVFSQNVMRKGAMGGFMAATDVADYLVKKNVPFRDAHAIVGQIVLFCVNNRKTLERLPLADYKRFSHLFERDLIDNIKLRKIVANRKLVGGTAPSAVKANIRAAEKRLTKLFPTPKS